MPLEARENYTWQAVYHVPIGSATQTILLNQHNPDGSKNSYREIKRKNLVQFRLISLQTGKTAVTVNLDENKKLIWRMRVAMNMMSGRELVRVHLVGWQENINYYNVQMFCALFPDGSVEFIDRFREGHEWLYPVVFNKDEKL